MTVPGYLTGYEELYKTDPRGAARVWFKQARYGLFLHYGLYSLLKRHEWVQLKEKMTIILVTNLIQQAPLSWRSMERRERLPDDMSIDTNDARVAVFGMGRVGVGAWGLLRCGQNGTSRIEGAARSTLYRVDAKFVCAAAMAR